MALASLIVKIGADLSDLNKALSSTDRQLQRFGGKMQRVGTQMSAAVTLPLVGIGVAATKMASDAEEAANKFDVVMGGSAARVRAELERLHSTVPLATHEMEGLAAGIQDMLVPMGVARDEGADMSAQMVALAGDLGSFNNASPSQVLEAMQSALAGSSEPMRRFGVDTREAALEAIALEQGLIQAGEKMDSTARAQAVLIAIQRDSTDAIGDAARTAGSAANSFKFFARDAKELGVAIGEILLPVVTPMVQKMSAGLRMFQGLSPTMQKVIVVVGGLAAAMGPLLVTLGTVLKMIPLIKLGFAALTGPVGLVIAAIVGLTTAWVIWGDDIKRIVSETVTAVRTWLVDRFGGIVDAVKGKIDAVTGFFAGMYDAVVGHSYVPDMIDGIEAEFARLDAVMVQPALAAASKVNNAFAGVSGIGLTQEGREKSLASRARMQEFTAAGGITNATMRGKRGDPNAGAKPISRLSRITDAFGDQIGGLLDQFGYVAAAAAVLAPVFQGFKEAIAPALDALKEPLRMVGQLLGAVITPVLELLAPPLRMLAKGVSYVVQAFGWLIEALGKFVDSIIPDWISKAGKGLAKAGQDMQDSAKKARESMGGVEDLGDAAAKAAGQLMNYANVVHINALRFRTTGSDGSGNGEGATGPGDAPFEQPGNRDPYDPDTRERRRRRNPYEQDQATNITLNVSLDGRVISQSVLRNAERAGRSGAPSAWTVATA